VWFNRKSTEDSQLLHRIEKRLDAVVSAFEEEKSANRRNLLEYAELGEKMRRLYLRIARRAKIETEQSSEDPESQPNSERPTSAKEIRQSIESQFGTF